MVAFGWTVAFGDSGSGAAMTVLCVPLCLLCDSVSACSGVGLRVSVARTML